MAGSVKIALLHRTLSRYLKEAGLGEDAGKLELVIATEDRRELADVAGRVEAQALVLDLDLLGDQPREEIRRLEGLFDPQLTVVTYSFAKWDLIEALRKDGRQLLRAPVSLRALRSSMISLIVRQITRSGAGAAAAAGTVDTAARPAARRFDELQLAGLQMVRSVVECECPNQVADLVIALNGFEDYSKNCMSRNAEDARVHAMLARMTGHARAILEEAMDQLCRHENIDPDRVARQAGSPAGTL